MARRVCRILLVLLLCALPLTPAARAFSDAGDSWAVPVAEQAAAYGLMEGATDGTFGFGRDITRGEFAAILCRMFSWELEAPESPSYIDCAPERWYYPFVETARAHGVTEPGGPVRPEDAISREEMAVMLVRALGYDTLAQSLKDLELPFADVEGGSGYIAIAYDIGMTTGVAGADGALYFRPSASAKREEAAAMLVRVYERHISRTGWLHGFYAFSSYSQINLTPYMDAVSVGWARMEYSPEQGAWLNETSSNGNDWVKPADPSPAVDYFQQHQTPCHLNVYASAGAAGGGQAGAAAVLSSPETRAQAVRVLSDAARDYAGLTLDFEGLGLELREAYADLLARLRDALPPEKTLYVCVQPDTWYGGYDYRALGETCDKVILMAHDYQWTPAEAAKHVGTAWTDSPVTPFEQVYRALRAITSPETGVADRSRVALALSFSTAGLHVDENGILLEDVLYHPARDVLAQRLQQEDTVIAYSERYRNPSALYTTEDGGRYRVWYEDAQSVRDKLYLARMFGVTGVSLWRLGIIPASAEYDVWSVVHGAP